MSARRPPRPGRRAPPLLLAAALVPVALALLPVVYIGASAWQVGAGGVWAEIARPRTGELLANTLTVALAVGFCAAVLGLSAAWLTEKTDLRWPRLARLLASLPLAMPAFVSSYAWGSLGPAFQTVGGAVLVLTSYSVPLVYLPVAAALRGMDPALEAASRSLGQSGWRTGLRIVLPQAVPALGGGVLLVVSHMLAEFGALAFLRVETFTTAIFEQYELQFDNAAAATLSGVLILLCVPVVALELRLRPARRLARLPRASARRPILLPLGRLGQLAAAAGFVLFAAVAFGVPFATLLYWLWIGSSAGSGLQAVGPALAGSLGYALGGAVLTTALALPVVLLALRHRGPGATLAERLPFLIHGLPGIVVALALVFLAVRYLPLVYQSPLLVLCAYAILFLPLAQSALRASAVLVPPEIEDAARGLGRGPLRAFASVTLPNLAPGVGAALALVVLQLMRELTATLLLAPTGVVTLATEFWSHTNDRAYAAAAPFAALIVLGSGIPVAVFTVHTLRRNGRAVSAASRR